MNCGALADGATIWFSPSSPATPVSRRGDRLYAYALPMVSFDDGVDRHLAEERRKSRDVAQQAATARSLKEGAADELIGLLRELADYLARKTAGSAAPPPKKRWWSTALQPKDEFVLSRTPADRYRKDHVDYVSRDGTLHVRSYGNNVDKVIDIHAFFAKGIPLGISHFTFSCDPYGSLEAIDDWRGGLDSEYRTMRVKPRDAITAIAAEAIALN